MTQEQRIKQGKELLIKMRKLSKGMKNLTIAK